MGAVSVGCSLTVCALGASHIPVAELTLSSLTQLALAPLWVWLAVGEVPRDSTPHRGSDHPHRDQRPSAADGASSKRS